MNLNNEKVEKKIKILFLAKYLDPGGVTVHMFELGRELMKRGFCVGIACGKETCEHNYTLDRFRKAGFYTYEIEFPGRDFNIIKAIFAFTKLIRVVLEYKPNIIHTHWRATSIYAEIISHIFKVPYVSSIHSDKIPAGPLYRLLSFWGEYAIAISKETYDYLHIAFKLPKSRIRLVHNGIDVEYFRPPSDEERNRARSKFGISQGKKVVCIIAKLTKNKGHDILFKAISLLKKKGINPIVICAGAGDKDMIYNWAQESDVLENIILPGFIDSRDVLWASDILALPSRVEGFPLVVIKAMACGVVPIRTSTAGAYDQIDDGINGFIISCEDYKTLADKIELLLTKQELRNEMSIQARKKTQEVFSLETMLDKIEEIYKDVLSQGS